MIDDNNWRDLKDLKMSSIERDLWPVTNKLQLWKKHKINIRIKLIYWDYEYSLSA